jgi:hypothetical protein
MTDLEICKRIAEIEGFLIDPDDKYPRYLRFKGGKHEGYKTYNPLTDDELCFKLMLKNDIVIRNRGNGYYLATVNRFECDARIANKNPNKAICLAIIEAHK